MFLSVTLALSDKKLILIIDIYFVTAPFLHGLNRMQLLIDDNGVISVYFVVN